MKGGSRRSRRARRVALAALAAVLAVPAAASAVDVPTVTASFPEAVKTNQVNLKAQIVPNSAPATFYFEYTTESAFLEHGFTGAVRVPSTGEKALSGSVPNASEHVGNLQPATGYRFRVIASNSFGPTTGPTRAFMTSETAPVFTLPDDRGWELVSPVDKNGGQIQGFGEILGGGVLQAAAQGGSVTYSSSSSFAEGQGAPPASQYLSTRSSSGWATENVTTPLVSGGYPETAGSGAPYQLFSEGLDVGLVSNGRRCRSSATSDCPVENPPPGPGAPAGFRNYYLRHADGSYTPLLSSSDFSHLSLDSEHFELALAGATPDLGAVVVSSCAALTLDATEVAGGGGECDPAAQNLYEKSGAAAPLLVNLRPGQSQGTPGAALASQSRAISSDGDRVYWTDGSDQFLREGSETLEPSATGIGAGATFETASTDGASAFYLSGAGHLWRYQASGDTATDVTPAGGVTGVLGASAGGSDVYFETGSGVFLWSSGVTKQVAPPALSGNAPPATGTARVSADGSLLLFVSPAPAAEYENAGFDEVYLYDASAASGSGTLVCVSCNPSGERPIGDASLPGASANGTGALAQHVYKPRVLSAEGDRVFFDSSDKLAIQDTDGSQDVYMWEADGTGSCTRLSGCIGLISNGRSLSPSSFIDASADGTDAYFLTAASLVGADPGKVDLYDARAGGGFAEPDEPEICVGDSCQPLPPEPEDPTPSTTHPTGKANPAPVFPPQPCGKGKVRRHGHCVKKHKPRRHRHHRRAGEHR